MYAEIVPVPSNGGTVWHVIATQPYLWRVEFACHTEAAAIALRLALFGVTDAIFEPLDPNEA